MNEPVPLAGLDRAALLALNNAHATELSWLEPAQLDRLLAGAALALGIAPMRAALVCFDQDSDYAGVNFAWFRARYPAFLYIDRVVVDAAARGQGLATRLYRAAFAAAAGRPVACEVNAEPPNPASAAFHAGLGFRHVGRAAFGAKTVAYLLRPG